MRSLARQETNIRTIAASSRRTIGGASRKPGSGAPWPRRSPAETRNRAKWCF